ncbi:hypothetical protein Tco_0842845 [Tanacetum coccineum]|uniref:Uncharacterized protein n=1 Tax=Tanacetum coccineum TaxID=301880 RepID=A0ABQ5B3P1_9ASTR
MRSRVTSSDPTKGIYSLKRDREDKDKDEDPPAGSDQRLKKQKTSKDAEPSRAEEPVFETADTEMPLNQGEGLGNTDDQPNVEAALKDDWFKKPKRPPTLDSDWNTTKTIDFRPPQTWISKIAKAEKPPTAFDELMSTPIDFSAYVLNNLKIENLTQEYLAVTDKLDWTNPEGHEYPFDLSKPLPLIKDQGRQVVPANYFFNNDLEYLKEDMVLSLWRLVKVAYDKYDMYLDEIIVRREDQQLYKFVEGDFPRLNLRDIEDMLLLLVQKNLSNMEIDDFFDLNAALCMFTRRVIILKRVEDLQLGFKSYQKKLNITRPETFRSDISSMTPYTAYNNPQGIIYQDKFQRNRLMRSNKLYKFCDDTLSSCWEIDCKRLNTGSITVKSGSIS